MKITSQNPLLMLALGVFLGGGLVGTAWILRPDERQIVNETGPEAAPVRRPSSSRAGHEGDFRGRERVEEKARSISAKDPREAWRRARRRPAWKSLRSGCHFPEAGRPILRRLSGRCLPSLRSEWTWRSLAILRVVS